jgi:hypothetical protein
MTGIAPTKDETSATSPELNILALNSGSSASTTRATAPPPIQ